MSGALDGIRIIDLTTVLMGPFATQLLGDMGADIVKVEPPGGDTTRSIGPARHSGMGSGFLHVNRNKRSVVLDLKHPHGHAALLRLVKTADVLIYNVRPQAMARLELTWDRLQTLNARLIYVGLFGYGQAGPYAAKPAYDDLIQGAIGVPSLVAKVGDGTPRYVPIAIIDRTVGVHAAMAVSAALYRREKTGRGQAIDIPMFETMVPFVLGEHLAGETFTPSLGAAGYPRMLSRARTPFVTQDGFMCALIYNDAQWRSFCRMIGRPEMMEHDPRLKSIAVRTEHIDALYAMVADILKTRTTAEWLALFDAADIPAVRLHSLESLPQDPHLQAVELIAETEHPSEGLIREVRPAAKWSESPVAIHRPAPRLGEHSAEILAEAGYSEAEIADLHAAGVTRLAPTQ